MFRSCLQRELYVFVFAFDKAFCTRSLSTWNLLSKGSAIYASKLWHTSSQGAKSAIHTDIYPARCSMLSPYCVLTCVSTLQCIHVHKVFVWSLSDAYNTVLLLCELEQYCVQHCVQYCVQHCVHPCVQHCVQHCVLPCVQHCVHHSLCESWCASLCASLCAGWIWNSRWWSVCLIDASACNMHAWSRNFRTLSHLWLFIV